MALRCRVRFAGMLVLLFVASCIAQEPLQSDLARNTNDALHAMSRLAGVIFTGQVVAVLRRDGGNNASGVVEIQFAVEDAIRGVSGSSYTLREWAGLWHANEQPFRVGQQYLMLLHEPSAVGLSSPVGGMDGVIPIHGHALIPADASGTNKTKNAAAGTPEDNRMADLRWVATHAIQPLPTRAQPEPHAMDESNPVAANHGTTGAVSAAPDAASSNTAYTTVLGMLQSWEKTRNATR